MDNLFVDDYGKSLKFFLQHDLKEEIQIQVSDLILSHGGLVTDKMPVSGYILVQPATAEEKRLRQSWCSAERPARFAVPFTFIQACIRAKKVLPQIFLHNCLPVAFHLHESIANRTVTEKTFDRISICGGNPSATEQEAQIIIADREADSDWNALIKKYETSDTKYVETPQWIKTCMDQGAIEHTQFAYRKPGGRVPGSSRTEFTEEDDACLARYIARQIPSKDSRGRTGNKIYMQMVEKADDGDPQFKWAQRHPWSSWLNRYKNHQQRLDNMIERYVKENAIVSGTKGQYQFTKRILPTHGNAGDTERDIDDSIEEKLAYTLPRRPSVKVSETAAMIAGTSAQSPVPNPTHIALSDSASQWPIREGTDSPPRWGVETHITAESSPKRKREARMESNGGAKKSKLETSSLPPTTTDTNDLPEQSVLQGVVEQIRSMAQTYRWSVDEVWEVYFDSKSDLSATLNEIKMFRATIDGLRRKDPLSTES